MLFSKTLIVLCFAAVAMAMEGMRCKCESAFKGHDYRWTKNKCNSLGKKMRYCSSFEEIFCETLDKGTEFKEDCLKRGNDCWVAEC
ncbi:MAG: hypothetical protein J3Q66DRAFT_70864 [Benniella sp.]|nr:MAG: hypothetical protein J3Q66DRAFT_70864 [Benniella sp.]